MYCSKCGTKIEEGVSFCSNCGTPVTGDAQPDSKRKQPKYKKKGTIIILFSVVLIALVALAIVFFLRGGCFKHEWREATCTEPKTCIKCGKTEGEALGHNWEEATCTKPKTCSVCGETEGNALEHTWVDATCTEPKTCSVCGETDGNASGHKWIEATYHSPKTCSVCGETTGVAKKSFFEQHNLQVSKNYHTLNVSSIVVNNYDHPTRTELCSTTIKFKSNYVYPSSSRSNYKTVKLCFNGRLLVPSFAHGGESPLGGLCDYYTGHSFTHRDTENDEIVELQDSVVIDGTKYNIYYTMTVEYLATMKWSASEGAYYTEYEVTYLVDIPKEYDGLVFYIGDTTEFGVDTSIHSGQIDPADNDYYFWLGKE